jgi:hypothetical protein
VSARRRCLDLPPPAASSSAVTRSGIVSARSLCSSWSPPPPSAVSGLLSSTTPPFLEGDVRRRLCAGGGQAGQAGRAGQADQAAASGVQVPEGDWGSDGLTPSSPQVCSGGFCGFAGLCGFASDGRLLHASCWDEAAAAAASIPTVRPAARWRLARGPDSGGQFGSVSAAPSR